MRTDLLSLVAGVVVCLILSGAGVYYIADVVRVEATQGARKQQENQTFGPFDEANADLLGIQCEPKPTLSFE